MCERARLWPGLSQSASQFTLQNRWWVVFYGMGRRGQLPPSLVASDQSLFLTPLADLHEYQSQPPSVGPAEPLVLYHYTHTDACTITHSHKHACMHVHAHTHAYAAHDSVKHRLRQIISLDSNTLWISQTIYKKSPPKNIMYIKLLYCMWHNCDHSYSLRLNI